MATAGLLIEPPEFFPPVAPLAYWPGGPDAKRAVVFFEDIRCPRADDYIKIHPSIHPAGIVGHGILYRVKKNVVRPGSFGGGKDYQFGSDFMGIGPDRREGELGVIKVPKVGGKEEFFHFKIGSWPGV